MVVPSYISKDTINSLNTHLINSHPRHVRAKFVFKNSKKKNNCKNKFSHGEGGSYVKNLSYGDSHSHVSLHSIQ